MGHVSLVFLPTFMDFHTICIMSLRVLLVLCVCVVLSRSELLGPDAKKKSEKSSDTEVEESEPLDTEAKVDPEYIKELTEAVNKEIVTLQEYADVIRKTKAMTQEETKGNENIQTETQNY